MLILAIESSCDETSAAIVDMSSQHRRILSDEIASQIEIHRPYGGVVPEIAGRAHIEAISDLTYRAFASAGLRPEDIDLVGVTNRPGLIGALLVGLNFAKSLAFSYQKPLVAVNHIKGHIAASYLAYPDLQPPFLALCISGGHSSIIHVKDYNEMETLGRTRDDAAGEAFDKAARVIGLPYPGGKEMDRLAAAGNPNALKLPKTALPDSIDFSFSGLKTAFLSYVNTQNMKGLPICREDAAASFTQAVVSAIIQKSEQALDITGASKLVLAGGVSANSHLRNAVTELCKKKNVSLYLPPLSLCGDNAAMIGAAAYYEYQSGARADCSLNAFAAHGIEELKLVRN